MNGLNSALLIDSREPWPHPWTAHFSSAVSVIRGTLETGDIALAALPDGAVIDPNAIIGTLAAWQRRYASFCFAGNVSTAARIGEAFLCGQVREVNRAVKALNNER